MTNTTVNQVPEAVPSDWEQLSWLHNRLASSKAFQKSRGWLGTTGLNVVGDTRRESPSVSKFRANLTCRFASMTVMGLLLERLRDKGWNTAYYELNRALSDEYYVISGEVAPLDKRVPMTLVMFEPKKTLAMLQWLFRHPLSELNRFTGLAGEGNQGQPTEATRELFRLFPSLERLSRERYVASAWDEGKEIFRAHKCDVLDEFIIPPRAIPFGVNWAYNQVMMNTTESTSRGNSGMTHPWAFLFRGWDQRKVLDFYSGVQDRIATWQFSAPAIFKWVDTTLTLIGLHGEDEHELWRTRHPSYVSKGVTQQTGAVIIPLLCSMERFTEYAGEPEEYLTRKPLRIVLKRSSDCTWKWNPDSENE